MTETRDLREEETATKRKEAAKCDGTGERLATTTTEYLSKTAVIVTLYTLFRKTN